MRHDLDAIRVQDIEGVLDFPQSGIDVREGQYREHSEPPGKVAFHLCCVLVPLPRQIARGGHIAKPNAWRRNHLCDADGDAAAIKFLYGAAWLPVFEIDGRGYDLTWVVDSRVPLSLVGHEFRWKDVIVRINPKRFG